MRSPLETKVFPRNNPQLYTLRPGQILINTEFEIENGSFYFRQIPTV